MRRQNVPPSSQTSDHWGSSVCFKLPIIQFSFLSHHRTWGLMASFSQRIYFFCTHYAVLWDCLQCWWFTIIFKAHLKWSNKVDYYRWKSTLGCQDGNLARILLDHPNSLDFTYFRQYRLIRCKFISNTLCKSSCDTLHFQTGSIYLWLLAWQGYWTLFS